MKDVFGDAFLDLKDKIETVSEYALQQELLLELNMAEANVNRDEAME